MITAKKITDIHMHLNAEMIRIIDRAVIETFSSFMGITPVLKHSEQTTRSLSEPFEVSGLIAFIQDDIEGTLAIRFNQATILKLLSRVYGEELTVVDNRTIGGVAEFANVIHGIAKEELNLQGYHYQMCLPVVIIGDNHSVVTALSGQKLILRYDLEGYEAVVELVLHNTK